MYNKRFPFLHPPLFVIGGVGLRGLNARFLKKNYAVCYIYILITTFTATYARTC